MADRLIRIGVAGSIVSAVCCFTPFLALVLSSAGLAAMIVYADAVLLPFLAGFIVLTGFALWRRRKKTTKPDPG